MLRNVRRPKNHMTPNFENTHAIRDKLMQEIAELQNKLDKIDGSPSVSNLSVAQSFKEMIYSREQMLGNLAQQKDERSNYSLERRLQ